MFITIPTISVDEGMKKTAVRLSGQYFPLPKHMP